MADSSSVLSEGLGRARAVGGIESRDVMRRAVYLDEQGNESVEETERLGHVVLDEDVLDPRAAVAGVVVDLRGVVVDAARRGRGGEMSGCGAACVRAKGLCDVGGGCKSRRARPWLDGSAPSS